MIAIGTETLVSMAEASAYLPDRPHVSTLHRWRLRGVRGIKLETCLVGGKRYTSHEALQRFVDDLSGDSRQPTASARHRRQEAFARSERELDAAGI